MDCSSNKLAERWRGSAAYGYVFMLDPISLAWEYLRRNPDYVRTWRSRHNRASRAATWSLKALEDPTLDGRDAVPLWQPLPPATVCLARCTVPTLDSAPFSVWGLPVHTRLAHDGQSLRATVWSAHGSAHVLLTPSLFEGEPMAYELAGGPRLHEGWDAVQRLLTLLASKTAQPRQPAPRARTALAHMRSLQALDGMLAGASQQEIAAVLFGEEEVARRWNPDSELRARVRYLIGRGRGFMQGGYRHLLYGSVEDRGARLQQGDEDPPSESPCSL